jgi:hypothetical protein
MFLGNFVLPIHAIYQIIAVWAVGGIKTAELINPFFEDKIEAKIIITIFCLAFLIIRFSMIIVGIWVVRQFGYGLKDKVYGKDGVFGDYWRSEEKTNWIVNDINETFDGNSGDPKEMVDKKKSDSFKETQSKNDLSKQQDVEMVSIPL